MFGETDFKGAKNWNAPDGTDYSRYRLTISDVAVILLKGAVITGVGALLCYNDIRFIIVLLPYFPVCAVETARRKCKERLDRLDIGFGDALRAVSASLESGYSVENAIREARRDLLSSRGESDPIMLELARMDVGLKNNARVEDLFVSLATRSGLEDIRSFATVFATVNRTGGNLVSVIGSTAAVIRTRVSFRRELRTTIAGRQLELRIMKLMPPFILLYLRIFMRETVGALYGNLFGVGFMTLMLVIYGAACVIADRMTDIEL